MKLIVIGDIHGRDTWKKIIKKEKPDRVIFLGDYFDSREINGRNQIDNFKEIINYAENNDTILLYGNHEHHYVIRDEKYSGFQTIFELEIREALEKNIIKELINVIYIYNNVIFSHAGITKTWMNSNVVNLKNINIFIYFLIKSNKKTINI